ncbi:MULTISPECIES: metalloregulator ArsR/SmtB family transcription factor [unclassified Duganella]|uniref:helix-turn-helix transcriptional regulator n=1 Tax=unclassified Duganella TaxID=2636909 RepID=UPI000E352BB5|nr:MULTISPECIES: metalloregulator ArsR/SmtB family transcription factor [unclassified Duganella]RFP16235.1 transcriptional regulator [Duganella sp. BJB475]RFP32603.1 transcriptional regulator [Duganella sp. BJB476]
MNTSEHTLFLLKTRGPQTAQQLGGLLNLTSMGARKQLESWQEKGMVTYEEVADKPGRPSRRWLLTEAGHARFPDRHADLTLQLIDQVRGLFGEAGLDKLIGAREAASEQQYRQHLQASSTLPQRVEALVQARSAEGYMAEVETHDDGSMLLIENHCPICAAARQCQKFCRSELEVFQRVLGPECSVGRVEHMLNGARRCVYVIKPL